MTRSYKSATLRVLLLVAFLCATVLGLWRLSDARGVQLFGRLVARVPTEERVVALTFDDGPSRRHTATVLELLRRKGVRATFFLVGREVVAAPDLAAAIAADGHELGNHSFNHRAMVLVRPSAVRAEIERTDSALRAIGYTAPIHFRPPFGKKLFAVPWFLWRTGRTTVTWDVEPESYPEVAREPSRIVEHVMTRVRPGSIVLLHVMYDSRETSRAGLESLIDRLQRTGYRFVTVSELMRLDRTGD